MPVSVNERIYYLKVDHEPHMTFRFYEKGEEAILPCSQERISL